MAVIVIATALQGSLSRTFSVPAGAPAHVQLDMVSPDFPTNAALTFGVQADRSLDGGVTFTDGFGSGAQGGQLGLPSGKAGTPGDGLYHQAAQWDGLASFFRVTITVNTPFTWGLTATVTAT